MLARRVSLAQKRAKRAKAARALAERKEAQARLEGLAGVHTVVGGGGKAKSPSPAKAKRSPSCM